MSEPDPTPDVRTEEGQVVLTIDLDHALMIDDRVILALTPAQARGLASKINDHADQDR